VELEWKCADWMHLGLAARPCEKGKETSSSTKGGEFLD
jgi:hypothetical protein